jgi:predicted ATPase
VALAEAVGHLTAALDANQQVPASETRDRQELDIRVALGTATQLRLGWTSSEVIRVLEPARELAIRLRDSERHFQILDYFQAYYLNRCDFPRVLEINAEVERLAQASGDSSAVVVALVDHALTQGLMGHFKTALQAVEQLLPLYDPTQHRGLVHTHYNFDPKCLALASAGHWLWAAGYPDRAREAAVEGLEWARRLAHPFNLCFFGLCIGSQALILRGEAQLARDWVEEAATIAREHALTYVIVETVPLWDGSALLRLGRYAEAYESLTAAQRSQEEAGGRLQAAEVCMMRARAKLGLGQCIEAHQLLKKALELLDMTDNRIEEAEVHRTLGEALQQQTTPDTPAAEASLRKALEVARSQEAKGFELRAAMSLAHLWQEQERWREARALLAPIYGWFKEGFDTKDLKEAKALLDELS